MPVSTTSRTNEKLYQARQLLQQLQPAAPTPPSLRNALLNSAVFAAYGAYLAFLLEIAVVHRINLNFIESLDQLATLLLQKGVNAQAVTELQRLVAARDWPAQLCGWFRSALGDDGWQALSKPKRGNAINIIDSIDVGLMATPDGLVTVLEKLRVFIDLQREHLLEW